MLGARRLRKLAPFLILSVTLWRFLYLRIHIISSDDSLYYQHTDWVIDGLLCGCALALWMRNERVKQALTRCLTLPIWLLLLGMLVVLIVCPIHLRELFEAVTIPLLLIGTILHPGWRISQMLEARPIAWIGRLSYSIYIWQSALFVQETPTGLQVFPFNILAILTIASLSYYLIERPLVKLGHRLSKVPEGTRKHLPRLGPNWAIKAATRYRLNKQSVSRCHHS